MAHLAQATVRPAAAIDMWTSFVKGSLGAFGLALLATAAFVPMPETFPYLPHYGYAVGALLLLVAATMRLHSVLIVLGCLALSAGLTFTLVGETDGDRNMAALALYSAAGLTFGAVARRFWMAIPFLLVPLLVVAPHGGEWNASREAFSAAWIAAVDCDCLWAGLPAGMAVVGAAIGEFRRHGWPDVRPSAVPLLIVCAGLVMSGLILASLMPDTLAFYRTVSLRTTLLAAALGWVGLAYQVGRLSFVWEAALASLLVLAGALFLDQATQFPDAFGLTLLLTVATSLVPAALAGVGLLVRSWIGKERPKTANVVTPHRYTAAGGGDSDLVAAAPAETGESGPPVPPPAPPAEDRPPPGAGQPPAP